VAGRKAPRSCPPPLFCNITGRDVRHRWSRPLPALASNPVPWLHALFALFFAAFLFLLYAPFLRFWQEVLQTPACPPLGKHLSGSESRVDAGFIWTLKHPILLEVVELLIDVYSSFYSSSSCPFPCPSQSRHPFFLSFKNRNPILPPLFPLPCLIHIVFWPDGVHVCIRPVVSIIRR